MPDGDNDKPGNPQRPPEARRRITLRRDSEHSEAGEESPPTLEEGPEPGKIIPELEWREVHHGRKPGDTFVRYVRPHGREFKRTAAGHLVVSERVLESKEGFGRVMSRMKRVLIGQRLATAELPHERLT